MERWASKLIALILTFAVTLCCTLLPVKVATVFERWGHTGAEILSHCMCFGGGVFFSIFILHMLPDVEEILHASLMEPRGISYPLPHLIVALGFFGMLFLERLTVVLNARRQKSREEKLKAASGSPLESLMKLHEGELKVDIGTGIAPAAVKSQTDEHKQTLPAIRTNNDVDSDKVPTGRHDNNNHPSNDLDTSKVETVYHDDNDIDTAKTGVYRDNMNRDCRGNEKGCELAGHDLSHRRDDHQGHSHDPGNLRGVRSLVLLLALSLHHVFEGMTVGLKHTHKGVWSLTLAILAHEVIIAFSLGLQLVKSTKRLKMIVAAALLCSSMLPVGVLIGMVITERGQEGNSLNVANGILQGIATGVFIYVTFFEILFAELCQHTVGFAKLLTMFLGFAVMALLGLVPEDIMASDLIRRNDSEIVSCCPCSVNNSRYNN